MPQSYAALMVPCLSVAHHYFLLPLPEPCNMKLTLHFPGIRIFQLHLETQTPQNLLLCKLCWVQAEKEVISSFLWFSDNLCTYSSFLISTSLQFDIDTDQLSFYLSPQELSMFILFYHSQQSSHLFILITFRPLE